MLKNLKAWDKEEKVLCDVKVMTNRGCFLVGNSPTPPQKCFEKDDEYYMTQEIKEGHFVYYKDLELYKKI